MQTLDGPSGLHDLDPEAADHLHRLMAAWQFIADLSFADLMLFVPRGEAFEAVGQLRPYTARTLHPEDLVGEVVSLAWHPYVERAWREGRRVRPPDAVFIDAEAVHVQAVPVRHGSKVIAVLSVEAAELPDRPTGRLETAYLRAGSALVDMVAEGTFPFVDMSRLDAPPRVGDGLVVLDAGGRVEFASPNAISAFRRLGITSLPRGEPLPGRIGTVVAQAGADKRPLDSEFESGDSVVSLRVVPLLAGARRLGSLTLCRDITELRRLGRALSRRDATIREVHHRVKNNLQTVASLLRLQARRLGDNPEAVAALEESVRRVGAIALVHETLTEELEGAADMGDVTRRVVRMLEGSITSDGVRIDVVTQPVVLDAAVATPVALVVAELVQNAVEHGLAGRGGVVEVRLRSTPASLLDLEVTDAAATAGGSEARQPLAGTIPGPGPAGQADQETASVPQDGLGLRLVRALIEVELGGRFDLRLHEAGRGVARVTLPRAQADSAAARTVDSGRR